MIISFLIALIFTAAWLECRLVALIATEYSLASAACAIIACFAWVTFFHLEGFLR